MKTARELRAERTILLEGLRKMVEKAEAENRDFTAIEQRSYDDGLIKADRMGDDIDRLERLPGDLPAPGRGKSAAYLRYGLGDSESRAIAAYIRRGDRGGIRELEQEDEGGYHLEITLPQVKSEMRATDEAMTLTAGDGGATVPTGLANQVAARKGAIQLSTRLGLRQVPGIGTTVNYPYENADPAVFASTSEQVDNHTNTYQRDRPTFATKAFTLVKYTKKLELTEELLDDEDANLMGFIGDHIGRAMALTHNSLLITEVGTNGTSLKTFASATAIAAGEVEDMCHNDTLSYYLDDTPSIGWVMKPSTLGAIKKITGDARLYNDQAAGSSGPKDLLNYPVVFSNSAGAMTAGLKPIYFGNWYFVGMREAPQLRIIRDVFSVDGLVILKYSFRCVYGVLIAGAIGYGVQAAS